MEEHLNLNMACKCFVYVIMTIQNTFKPYVMLYNWIHLSKNFILIWKNLYTKPTTFIKYQIHNGQSILRKSWVRPYMTGSIYFLAKMCCNNIFFFLRKKKIATFRRLLKELKFWLIFTQYAFVNLNFKK